MSVALIDTVSSRLIVKGISGKTDEAALKATFSKHGIVTDVRVMRDKKTGKSRQFGFIGFKDTDSAQAAQKFLHNSFLGTSKISVEFAKSISQPKPMLPIISPSTVQPVEHIKKDGLETFLNQMTRSKGKTVWADDEQYRTKEDITAVLPDNDTINDIILDSNQSHIDDLSYLKQHIVSGWDSDDEPSPSIKAKSQFMSEEYEDPQPDEVVDETPLPLQSENVTLPQSNDDLLDTGRLMILNLPYSTRSEDIRSFFDRFGTVRDVHICLNEDTKVSRGFGFVTFVFPEHAVKVLAEGGANGFLYEGRIIKVSEAKNLMRKSVEVNAKRTYKLQNEMDKRLNAHKMEHTWNLLYVSSNSAASAMATTLGVSKGNIIDIGADDLAVRTALAETEVIAQTTNWLKSEGIRVSAFERKGESLAAAKSSEGRRSKTTIIVKHLPCDSMQVDSLRAMFSKYGELLRFLVSPSKTVAIAQYTEENTASKAFSNLSFRRYVSVPLYLEWAPEDIFENNTPQLSEAVEYPMNDAIDSNSSLFVKNVPFSTTENSFENLFSGLKGYMNARLMMKKSPDGSKLSMGYGFVQFRDMADTQSAMKKTNGITIDGKVLQVKLVEPRENDNAGSKSRNDVKTFASKGSNRLSVRNIAFEATKEDIRKLFGSYGNVTSVRIPKKTGENQHRGFAFVDFVSRADALRALEKLQHTHLYGRRLVLEPADNEEVSVEDIRTKALKQEALREGSITTQSKRRKLEANRID